MQVPNKTKTKLDKLTRPDLMALAIQNGKLEAFNAHDNNYELASKLIGLDEEYKRYMSLVKDENGMLKDNFLHYLHLYRTFLLAKICFPEDFEESKTTNRTNPQSPPTAPVKPKLTPDDLKADYGDLYKLDLEQLKELAIKNGNLAAYEMLIPYDNYELSCRYLGLEKEYKAYRVAVKEALNVSREKILQVEKDFERFLLLKLCFPEDFQQ